MDCRLTDAVADPEAEGDRWHTERLVRLPDTMWCYRPANALPDVTRLPPRRAGEVTFASLNNFPKLNSQVFALWTQLLRRLPGSKLIITNAPGGRSQEFVVQNFKRMGVTPERLALYDRLSQDQFVELFSKIDIALDPFPYCGTTTTCDVLWMGIPVVTLTGQTTPSRSGASLLRALYLDDLVAHTEEQYLDVAERLALNPDRLVELRATLRERMRSSTLMNAARFTGHLEQAYRSMWRDWCDRH